MEIRRPDTTQQLAFRFWRSASGFWRGPSAWSARLITALLIVTVLIQLAVQFRLNYWSRDFFDAFGRRDSATLRQQALLFLPLAGSSMALAGLAVWARMTVQRLWRAWLTGHLIEHWLAYADFRHLQFTLGEDQNPEYRIAEDARVATDAPVAAAIGLLTSALSVIIFVSILWTVGGDLVIGVSDMTLTVPKYLVISVVIYSMLLTGAIAIIGRRLIRVIASKNAAEAQFRSIGSHLRERGAVSKTSQDEGAQRRSLGGAVDDVIARWREVCHQLVRITVVSHGNVLLAPIIGWVLCAPKYLVGTMSLGQVAQATAAFVVVLGALNWLVDNYPGLVDCLSSINRVASLLLALDELERAAP